MKLSLTLIFMAALSWMARADSTAEISVITLVPGRVIAIQRGPDGGSATTYTVYNLTVTVAVDAAGNSMQNVSAPVALAYAQSAGIAP
jgi:hypothetical protein